MGSRQPARIIQSTPEAEASSQPHKQPTNSEQIPSIGSPFSSSSSSWVFSSNSTPAVPDSLFFNSDFLLGAGMAIIQPSSGKVVVLYDSRRGYWFLPKGRKDIGEKIEDAALRESYEESGYRVEFLPLFTPTNAPASPASPQYPSRDVLNTEPIYINITMWGPRRRKSNDPLRADNGGEYLIFWYVGQISENPAHEEDTGMPDEKNFSSHILDIEEALGNLCLTEGGQKEAHVLRMAHNLWTMTKKRLEGEAEVGKTLREIDVHEK